MTQKLTILTIVPLLFLSSQLCAQDRAFPYLKSLDVFTGTFEGTTILPSGTTGSERLGEVQGKKVTIIETSRWAPGKCAQIVDISYAVDGAETILGTTLIGWDQSKKKITSTQVTTHKGVWSGTVERDGKKWIFSYEGYNLDGKKASGKRIITFTDDDHYTSVDTESVLDGKPQPDVTWHFKRL